MDLRARNIRQRPSSVPLSSGERGPLELYNPPLEGLESEGDPGEEGTVIVRLKEYDWASLGAA